MCGIRDLRVNKKETLTPVFSCECCDIFKNTFLYRTPPVARVTCSDVPFGEWKKDKIWETTKVFANIALTCDNYLLLALIPYSTFLRRKLCIKNISCFKVSGIPEFHTTLCVENKILKIYLKIKKPLIYC